MKQKSKRFSIHRTPGKGGKEHEKNKATDSNSGFRSLAQIASNYGERNDAIVAAYSTGSYSYREIADYFGIHLATVGRIVRKSMQQCEN